MALGEWLSVNSSRELYQRQIDTERQELETIPDEEKEEMVLIYQAKGLDEPQARALAERLMKDKNTALDTLVREELGIDPEELGGSAWAAAGASFCLFAAGAVFPVIPYMVLTGWDALLGSIVLSGFALALIGAGTSLFTGRHVGVSAARQVAIGLAAAAITYGIGRALGVSLS
jgi:VIT1/CCC1 family predicted Fe2+/Mn2+ transporter